MIKVYPYPSGSEVTASYAISASHAVNVESLGYVYTASKADVVVNPESGSHAAVDLCFITFAQYQLLMSGSGSNVEVC